MPFCVAVWLSYPHPLLLLLGNKTAKMSKGCGCCAFMVKCKYMKIEKIDPVVMKISRKNKLTLKQTKFVGEYIKSGNGTEAIKKAYPKKKTENMAAVMASENIRKPQIEKTITEIMTDQGLTKKSIIATHKDIRDAAFEEKDFSNAHKCNQDFLKMSGALKEGLDGKPNNYYINADSVDVTNIDKLLAIDNG